MSKTKFIVSLVVIAALASTALASAANPAPKPAIPASKSAATPGDEWNLAASTVAKRKEPKPKPKPAAPSGPVAGVSQSTIDAIAACESGGDPTAVNAGGYYGKYQFDLGTWASVGGSGNPADASEGEQDYRASLLYSRAGSSPWPVCGQ